MRLMVLFHCVFFFGTHSRKRRRFVVEWPGVLNPVCQSESSQNIFRILL